MALKKRLNVKLPNIIMAFSMNFVDGKFFATGKREGCVNLGSSGLNFFFTGCFLGG